MHPNTLVFGPGPDFIKREESAYDSHSFASRLVAWIHHLPVPLCSCIPSNTLPLLPLSIYFLLFTFSFKQIFVKSFTGIYCILNVEGQTMDNNEKGNDTEISHYQPFFKARFNKLLVDTISFEPVC